jgi:fucose permease
LSLLQTASNPYNSIIGPIESAAQRISIMGICNKVAGILSPIVLGYFVLKDVDKLEERVNATTDPAARDAILTSFASTIYWPYITMAVILALLAFWITRSALPKSRLPTLTPHLRVKPDIALPFSSFLTCCWARSAFLFMWAWRSWRAMP